MDKHDSLLTKWSRFFVNRYRVTILLLLAIVIAGLWGATNNQRQDFPTIPINFVFIGAAYPGASPADVEQDVIAPIEQAISSFDGIESIRSTAQNSYGSLQVNAESVDITPDLASKINEELGKIGLPEDVDASVQTFDATGPSIAIGLVGTNGETTEDLLPYASTIAAQLQLASNDIKRVEIAPEDHYNLTITLDSAKLVQNQLSFESVKGAIQSQIVSLPGGSLETSDGKVKSITINAPVTSIEDLQNISLGRVLLSDVATIERIPKNGEVVHYVGYVKDNEPFARESVYFLIYKKNDGDVITISQAVQSEIERINTDGNIIPENMELVTGYDISPYVEDQLSSLLNNGYLGLVLILIVLLFFINFRTAVVVALIIPIVLLISLFALNALDYSLNILTLFAMILTLGILVDNAIVIAEGMVHELEKGASRLDAAITSIKKLGPAVTAATATTVVVFIPFANIGGIMGDFLKYIPYTIMIVLVASFFVAVSITPLLGRFFLKEQTYEDRRAAKISKWAKYLIIPAIVHYGQNLVDKIANWYADMMQIIFQSRLKKFLTIAVTVVLLGTSFAYFAPKLPFEQFPSQDGTSIQVDFEFPVGTPAQAKEEVFVKTQSELIALPYFKTFYTFGETIYATFSDPVDRPDEMSIFEINDILEQGLTEIRKNQPDNIRISSAATSYGPPASEFDIVVELLGSNDENLRTAANELTNFLLEKDGVERIINGPTDSLVPSIDVDLDQSKLTSQGVNALVAAGTVNAFFSPQQIGSIIVRDDGVSDDLVMKFSDASTDDVEDLRTLFVPSATRIVVPLSSVANIEEVQEPISIKRLDGQHVATISIAVSDDADLVAMNSEISDYLSEEQLASWGLAKDAVKFGGEFSDFESDYSNLQIVFILAMLGVYLILVYQFHSYMQPALILFAVPLALIGVFPGLYTVGSTLNMISGLGIVALVGIVVNDAIVFIATYNRYREEYLGESVIQTLVRAGRSRFKPIFSTSITTIGGILPLTIYDPFWTGLGTSIIAGLIFSTLGTLIVLPVIYSVGKSITRRLLRIVKRNEDAE